MTSASRKEVITVDLENGRVTVKDEKGDTTYPMDTQEAFSAITRAWLRCGWENKYVYRFS